MSELSADETVQATADPIHDIGTMIYLSRETFARAAEWGWQNPFGFYAAGRGGVLGDVDGSIVASTFGWFEPKGVAALWADGVSVQGADAAAARMGEATALWGRDHLAGIAGIDEWCSVASAFVDGAEGSGLPLFEGWRGRPRPDDAPGQAAVLLQTLREWRGAVHLVATTAVGLAPLEAILTSDGPGQAKLFGWPEPYPDSAALQARRDEAQTITDRLCAKEFDRVLSGTQRRVFADGVTAIRAACP